MDDLKVSIYNDDLEVVVDAAIALNGKDGVGLAAGGLEGQILTKKTNVDFDTEWANPQAGLPVDGTAGQLLTKLSAAPLDTAWQNPPFVAKAGDEMTGSLFITSGTLIVDHTGTGADSDLFLRADNQASALLRLQTGSVDRWRIGKDDAIESGANAGSNFIIKAYNDAGVASDVLHISRATQTVAFAVSPTAPTPPAGDNTTKLATTQYVRTEFTNFIAQANTFTATQTIMSTDAGSGVGPILALRRNSASPAVNDNLGEIQWLGNNAALSNIVYADAYSNILDPTTGSMDGRLTLRTMVAGVLTAAIALGPGVGVGTATPQGVNTLNALTLYENSVALESKYAQIMEGVPSGGDTQAILLKASPTSYDADWGLLDYIRCKAGDRELGRAIYARFGDVINVNDFYQSGETPGTSAIVDTAAFKAAIAYCAKINGGTVWIPACATPRLINGPLTISYMRRSSEDLPEVPVSPDANRKTGSIRIVGAGGVAGSSVFDLLDGVVNAPCVIQLETGTDLFDIVSATRVFMQGMVLQNNSDTAETILRVRAYGDPTSPPTSCVGLGFDDIQFRLLKPVSEAQTWVYDCKHVDFRFVHWLHGADNAGVPIPCLRIGEDEGVNPTTLIDGDAVWVTMDHCFTHGNIDIRRLQNVTIRNHAVHPIRKIDGGTGIGCGKFTGSGNFKVRGLHLEQFEGADGRKFGTTPISETFADFTLAQECSDIEFKGQWRNWDKVIIMDGEGPLTMGGFTNNPAGSIDVTFAATASKSMKFTNMMDQTTTVANGGTAVSDLRTGPTYPVISNKYLVGDLVTTAPATYITVVDEVGTIQHAGWYEMYFQMEITSNADSLYRAEFQKNSVVVTGTPVRIQIPNGRTDTLCGNAIIWLDQGTFTFRVRARQETSFGATIQGSDTASSTFMHIKALN